MLLASHNFHMQRRISDPDIGYIMWMEAIVTGALATEKVS